MGIKWVRQIPMPAAVSIVLEQNFHSGECALASCAVKLLSLIGLPLESPMFVPSFLCSHDAAGMKHEQADPLLYVSAVKRELPADGSNTIDAKLVARTLTSLVNLASPRLAVQSVEEVHLSPSLAKEAYSP